MVAELKEAIFSPRFLMLSGRTVYGVGVYFFIIAQLADWLAIQKFQQVTVPAGCLKYYLQNCQIYALVSSRKGLYFSMPWVANGLTDLASILWLEDWSIHLWERISLTETFLYQETSQRSIRNLAKLTQSSFCSFSWSSIISDEQMSVLKSSERNSKLARFLSVWVFQWLRITFSLITKCPSAPISSISRSSSQSSCCCCSRKARPRSSSTKEAQTCYLLSFCPEFSIQEQEKGLCSKTKQLCERVLNISTTLARKGCCNSLQLFSRNRRKSQFTSSWLYTQMLTYLPFCLLLARILLNSGLCSIMASGTYLLIDSSFKYATQCRVTPLGMLPRPAHRSYQQPQVAKDSKQAIQAVL